jgi:hypothetical protein
VNRVPKTAIVQCEVVVDDSVAQARHLDPRDLGMRCAERSAHAARRLSDDLDRVRYGQSQELVALQLLSAVVAQDPNSCLRRIQHVVQADAVLSTRHTLPAPLR